MKTVPGERIMQRCYYCCFRYHHSRAATVNRIHKQPTANHDMINRGKMRAEWPSKHVKQGARKRNMEAENTIDTRCRQTNHPCTQTHTPNHQEQQRVSYHQRCKKRTAPAHQTRRPKPDQIRLKPKGKRRRRKDGRNKKTDKNSSRCPFLHPVGATMPAADPSLVSSSSLSSSPSSLWSLQ
jgi:hypothetical protein